MQTEMAYWRRFDADVVVAALREHIAQRPEYRESYTRGIMRNMQAAKDGGKKAKPNSYHKIQAPKENFESQKRDLNCLIE